MGEEESAQVLERQAIDQLRRKRLRRIVKRRQFNKGKLTAAVALQMNNIPRNDVSIC